MLAVEQMAQVLSKWLRCWASDSCMVRAFGATRQQALQQQPASFAAATSKLCSSNQQALQQQPALRNRWRSCGDTLLLNFPMPHCEATFLIPFISFFRESTFIMEISGEVGFGDLSIQASSQECNVGRSKSELFASSRQRYEYMVWPAKRGPERNKDH